MTRAGDRQVLDEQAIAWLVRLHAGDDADADWSGLEAWLSENPAHLDAFERVEGLWAELGERSGDIAPLLAPDPLPEAQILPLNVARKPAPKSVPSRAWAAWASAGALAAAAAAAVFVLAPAPPTAYATAHGETRRIVLNDGTQIDLNSASHVSVRFDGHVRRVKVDDAEATFDVAHDPARPFVISVGDQQIRVVGTQFNVRRRDAGLTLTVSRGVVEVTPLAGEGIALRLTAGDQLARRDGDATSVVRHVSPAEAFAWRQHRLICHACTLGDIAGDLNRAFATPIDVDTAARSLTFSGVLVLDDEDAVVRRLGAFLPIKADRSSGRIVLSSAR